MLTHATSNFSPEFLARRYLRALRFLSYAGSQFSSLLVPLIVFQLTKDVSVAAVVLVAERIAKVLLYVPAGVLVSSFGIRRVHQTVELLRLISLLWLLGFALGYFNSLAWLIVPAVVSHACAGLMNVVFELGIVRLWSQKERVTGYAAVIRDEQLGLLFALLGGVIVGRVDWLCWLALLSQGANFLLLERSRESLYGTLSPALTRVGESFGQLKAELKSVWQKPLLQFGAASILTGLPITVIHLAGPYYLARSAPGLDEPTRWFSFMLMASSVAAVVVIQFLGSRMHQQAYFTRSVKWGFGLALAFSLVCIPTLPLGWAVFTAVAAYIGGATFVLGQRHFRQVLITEHTSPEVRAGVTSLMLSIEAWRYLGGALLLMLWPGPLAGAITIATLLALLAAWKHPIHAWLKETQHDSFSQ
jgi:hypothetical protein